MAKFPTFIKDKPEIDQLRDRHQKEIEALQSKCKHKKSTWAEEYWAIGHGTGNRVKVCDNCGKALKKKSMFEKLRKKGKTWEVDHVRKKGT